ncbi:MAG: histidinol-phosphate transaminase [Opitutales bacterium]
MKEINLEGKVAKSVTSLHAYVPGEQPKVERLIKLNTNEMPYAPSPKIKEAIVELLGNDAEILRLYPNPSSAELRKAIAQYYEVCECNAFAGNGSDDILNLLIRAFADTKLKVGALNPSYSLYPVLSQIQGAEYVEVDFDISKSTADELPIDDILNCGANLFFLTNPNAPTSLSFAYEQIEELVSKFNGIVVIDEAYAPFAEYSCTKLIEKYENVLVCTTASKAWALAGMRIGWAIASAKIIEVLDKVRDSYNLDTIAQRVAITALQDKAYHQEMCKKVIATRQALCEYFDNLGWFYFKPSANFIFVKPQNKNGENSSKITLALFQYLKDNAILVRYFANDAKINEFLRISIGSDEEIAELKNKIESWINERS